MTALPETFFAGVPDTGGFSDPTRRPAVAHNLMLEAALQYAAIGWPIFACHAGTKDPATSNGFYAATTDEATIRAWWAKYPNANIGFYPHGAGLSVIDVDVKNGGDGFTQLEVLEITHGDLPHTQKQESPSGGEHILFRTSSPMPNNKLSADIDIRCANGYIMLAPSIADGRAYEWIDGWSPADAVVELDFAEMPQWVIDVQQARIQEAAKPSNDGGKLSYVEPDENAQASIAERLPAFLDSAPKAKKRFDGGTDGLRDTSGSAMDFSMCALLKIGGFDYSETRFILESWPHGSNSTQRGGDRYWERAWLRSSDPEKETAAMLDAEIEEALGADQPDNEKKTSLKPISLLDVMSAELEEVSFAVDKIFPKRHVTLFGGHGGMGKSLLALTIAAHVAAGAWFAGLPVEQSKVLFVSLEDEASIVKVRLRKIIRKFNLDAGDVLNNLMLLDGTGTEAALMTQSTEFNGKPEMTKVFVELAHASKNTGLVMIDNASDAYDGSENVRKEVRFFIRNLARMARARNASVVLLAHIDKAAQRNGTNGDDYSGSTAWHNSARSRVALKHDPSHTSTSDDPVPIVLEHQKANLSSKIKPLRFEFDDSGLIVPIDDHGDGSGSGSDIDRETWDAVEIVRCIKLAIEQYEITVPTRHTAGNGSVMQAIEGIKEYPSTFKGGAGRKRATAAILLAKSKKWIIEESYTDHNKNAKQRFVVSSTYVNPIDLPI